MNVGSDFLLEIAKGNVAGHLGVSRFGTNPDIDMNVAETIWTNGNLYVHPTEARIHDVVSSDSNDAGTLVISSIATNNIDQNGSKTKLFDDQVDFVALGVRIGDTVLNDKEFEFGTVTEINNPNQITVLIFRCIKLGVTAECNGMSNGNAYRIVSPASSGAYVGYIEGLSSAFRKQSEFIITDGTNGVPTLKSYRRVFRMELLGAGSSLVPEGNITATAQVDGTISSVISSGKSQSEAALITVPRDFTAFMTSWWASVLSQMTASATLRLEISEVDRPNRVREPIYIAPQGTPYVQKQFEVPEVITEMSDIELIGETSDNSITMSGGFSLILVRNKFVKGSRF